MHAHACAFRLLRLSPWGFLTDPLLFTYEELRTAVLKRCCSASRFCEACRGAPPQYPTGSSLPQGPEGPRGPPEGAPGVPAGGGPERDCECWKACTLRYVQGTDEEVHDTQRVLAMPQVLLRASRCCCCAAWRGPLLLVPLLGAPWALLASGLGRVCCCCASPWLLLRCCLLTACLCLSSSSVFPYFLTFTYS